jgi:Flp pilus assembly protein TadD
MELIDGDADRAVATAERAARLYPDDGSSLAMLGRALLRRGEAEPGMAALRRSLAADWHGDLGARAEAETEVRALHE